MATLILDRSDLELRSDGTALAVYEAGERRGSIALNLVDRVVMQGRVRLDTSVLARLGEAGVTTAFLSGRQSRRVAFLLGVAHSDASVRLAQYQWALDAAACDRWAVLLVAAKARGQLRLLRAALEQRPDCRKPLTDAIVSLDSARLSLRAQPALQMRSVRGVEGAAAAAYFRGLTCLFPESLGFAGRNRRPPRDPVNACLSLGYTLLHFEAVHACHTAGLDPLIGFYHRPAFGRESMACDLIEPLRSRVDAFIWELFRTRALRADAFVQDKGACLLNKGGRARLYAEWERQAGDVRRKLRRACAALVRILRHRGEPLLENGEGENEE